MKILIWHYSSNVKKNIIPALMRNKRVFKILGIISKQKIQNINCYKDRKSIIDLKPDYVFISSITSSHFKEIEFCLKNKINVIVEKPISDDYSKVKYLIKLARNKNLKLIEALMFLYHPQFYQLSKILNLKKNGNLLYGNIFFTIPHLDKNNFRYQKKSGGGAHLDLGIYIFSFLFFIFGKNIYLKETIIVRSKKNVDINCLFIFGLRGNKPTQIIGKCGFGFNYNNRLDFIYENKSIKANLIFSKPRISSPKIEILDGLEINKTINFNKNLNQFDLMFDYIYKEKINFRNYYKNIMKLYKFYFSG
jgi:predicted dehydrogenase